jgi:hypothetical protein
MKTDFVCVFFKGKYQASTKIYNQESRNSTYGIPTCRCPLEIVLPDAMIEQI